MPDFFDSGAIGDTLYVDLKPDEHGFYKLALQIESRDGLRLTQVAYALAECLQKHSPHPFNVRATKKEDPLVFGQVHE